MDIVNAVAFHRPAVNKPWRHSRAAVDTTLAYSSADVDVTHCDAEKERRRSTASYREDWLEQYIQQQWKHAAPTMMHSLVERQSKPGASSMVEQPTKIMKNEDVPQGVRSSYSCLCPQSMWACRHRRVWRHQWIA